jgi:hypothetical protein
MLFKDNTNHIDLGMNIMKKGKIFLPNNIAKIMVSIYESIDKSDIEFGIYLKGTWDFENLEVAIADDAYIFPEQITTPTSIQFIEDAPSKDYNVVIHRHPNGCTKFSGVDDNSLNREFLASILYIPYWSFPDAVINIPIITGTKLQIQADVIVDGTLVDIDTNLYDTIQEKLNIVKNIKRLKNI